MAARARGLTTKDEAEWARFAGRIVPLPDRAAVVSPEVDVPGVDGVEPRATPPSPGRRGPATVAASPSRPVALGIGAQPPGVDSATWQRFHRGQVDGVRKLDLHGMTAQHAFASLRAFMRTAHADRVRCVEIVTGRGNGEGGGVLRRELPHWLNLPEIRPMVLAAAHPRISSAMHAHSANSGSVRLLLRRPRK